MFQPHVFSMMMSGSWKMMTEKAEIVFWRCRKTQRSVLLLNDAEYAK